MTVVVRGCVWGCRGLGGSVSVCGRCSMGMCEGVCVVTVFNEDDMLVWVLVW